MSDLEHSTVRFLTVADAAEILNVTLAEVYTIVRSGELPAIRVGSHSSVRIERTMLEAYIEAKYEENRRINLWNQSEFDSLPEISGGRIIER